MTLPPRQLLTDVSGGGLGETSQFVQGPWEPKSGVSIETAGEPGRVLCRH